MNTLSYTKQKLYNIYQSPHRRNMLLGLDSVQTNSITLVVAHARNHVIGREGGMPWHLPADLAHFKAVTLNKPVIMGRRTFQSIGNPLPGRVNIVATRDTSFTAEGIAIAHSLDEALAVAGDVDEVMVIGGAEIYRLALPRASRIHLTLIDADIDGDTHFPEYDDGAWREVSREYRAADARNSHPLSFITLERMSAP